MSDNYQNIQFEIELNGNLHIIQSKYFYEFMYFIIERQNIFYKKEILKLPPPWTDDLILDKYLFLNNNRVCDKTTRYEIDRIKEHTSFSQSFNFILFFRKCLLPRIWEAFSYNRPELLYPPYKSDAIFYCAPKGYTMKDWMEEIYTFVTTNTTLSQPIEQIIKDSKLPSFSQLGINPYRDGEPFEIKQKRALTAKKIVDYIYNLHTHKGNKIHGEFTTYEVFLSLTYTPYFSDYFTENDYYIAGPGTLKSISLIDISSNSFDDKLFCIHYLTSNYLSNLDSTEYFWTPSKYYPTFAEPDPPKRWTIHDTESMLCEYRKYFNLKEEILTGKNTRHRIYKGRDFITSI